jgi:hypothetical protein
MGIERRLERLQVHYYIRAVLVPRVLDSYLDSIPTAISGYIAFKGAITAVTGHALSAYLDLVARPREARGTDPTPNARRFNGI